MFKRLLICLVSLVGVCAPLNAAPIFFVNDVSGFTSQAGVLSYDSFEYLSHSESSPIAFNGGEFTCVTNTSWPCPNFFGAADLAAESARRGDADIAAYDGDISLGFTTDQTGVFTFDSPVTAFSIFIGGAGNILDGGDLVSNLITLDISVNGQTQTVLNGYGNVSPTFPSNTNFIGVIDLDGISSVSFFGLSSGRDAVYLDYMGISTESINVTAPTSLLGALGLLLLALCSKRRV